MHLKTQKKRRHRRQGRRKIFKIMAENFPKIMKNIMPQICEVWRML